MCIFHGNSILSGCICGMYDTETMNQNKNNKRNVPSVEQQQNRALYMFVVAENISQAIVSASAMTKMHQHCCIRLNFHFINSHFCKMVLVGVACAAHQPKAIWERRAWQWQPHIWDAWAGALDGQCAERHTAHAETAV